MFPSPLWEMGRRSRGRRSRALLHLRKNLKRLVHAPALLARRDHGAVGDGVRLDARGAARLEHLQRLVQLLSLSARADERGIREDVRLDAVALHLVKNLKRLLPLAALPARVDQSRARDGVCRHAARLHGVVQLARLLPGARAAAALDQRRERGRARPERGRLQDARHLIRSRARARDGLRERIQILRGLAGDVRARLAATARRVAAAAARRITVRGVRPVVAAAVAYARTPARAAVRPIRIFGRILRAVILLALARARGLLAFAERFQRGRLPGRLGGVRAVRVDAAGRGAARGRAPRRGGDAACA